MNGLVVFAGLLAFVAFGAFCYFTGMAAGWQDAMEQSQGGQP
ncbi:hypothetical protein OJF2_51240 [Aquisphaera giovannonii]|uniref:Uncharacterized protein n=1 Tax=Aquisphaera giovannonii TaxID=406548 RepID=A0A5B9W9M8_9BACT|nr:hypothetical protein [Aquisphaera giovannonii]QEH36540.1 hypothetical protein OJF2_51240 [Aquisphaera giovannonii]